MNIKCLAAPPYGTNCYILEDGGQAAVIDPGGAASKLLEALEGLEVRYIFLTHGHYDHTGGVEGLMAKWPEMPVYLNSRDFPGDAPYLRRLFPPIPGTRNYGEGDVFTVGGLKVSVMETPGHSEGSVTLRCGDVLFCGDTLFAGSCGRVDLPGGDEGQMWASLARLGRLTEDWTVWPGHGEATSLDYEKQTNPYLRQALAR